MNRIYKVTVLAKSNSYATTCEHELLISASNVQGAATKARPAAKREGLLAMARVVSVTEVGQLAG